MEFHVEDHPDPLDVELLEARIRSEASTVKGLGDEVELAIFVRDAGTIIAGISGWTWGDCCELQSLWVAPHLRGRGLATRLIAAAEAEAATRGCLQTVHFTYDFQAQTLYERNGYDLVGRVQDFPSGTDALWYRKRLEATSRDTRARHDRASHASDVRNSAKMWPVGWEALEQWGDDVARIEPLAGGVANDVWSVRVNGHLAVGRLGARSDADLAWETELLQHLDREGLTVPVPIPTTDGRLFADGLVVMTYVDGGPPETEDDWRRVADTLRQLHRLTPGWPQRPGWQSSTDLLHAEIGTKIDLGAMPREDVARCRAAWARLTGRQTCVVHGNPNNPGNVRMTANRVALIDWDESHVDVPDLDLVLPHNAAGLDDSAHDIAAQASAAWEAAVCWDDEYAVKRLAEVRAV